MLKVLSFLSFWSRPKLGETVKEQLKRLYGPHTVFSYENARRQMYNNVDCINDSMYLVYGGNTQDWKCGGSSMPSSTLINAEHTIPQSFFNSKPPMVSDLHHLFSSPAKLNSMRSNYPFVQIDYSQCIRFCHNFDCQYDRPSNPDLYSCLGSNGKSWMPIKSGRGQVARAIFYFFTMYDTVRLEQVGDVNTFKEWNRLYPPSITEKYRNDMINKSQGNRNPYIDDPSLVDLAFP